MTDVCTWTIQQLAQALASKEVSSVQITEAVLARIGAMQHLGAYVHVDAENALRAAQASDARRMHGKTQGVLDGVPVALKDIFLTEGVPTTCASRILQHFVAPYDASVVTLLKNQGAVLLGKLNMDEFAMGSSNEHSAWGLARNPWDVERVPGGSSGGSAVAVCAGLAFGALGTDTGGSIRQPAGFTGTVGLKPTYGRVSRYGVMAYASSLDQVGPMTKDVTDCAWMLQAIAGFDAKDATSARVEVPDYRASLEEGVRGLKIGVPQEYFAEGLDPEIRTLVEQAMKAYEGLGAVLVPVSMPHTHLAIATYYVIASAEASSNLARYDGVRFGHRSQEAVSLGEMYVKSRSEGFGQEVKRRIVLGTYVLSSGYYDAYYTRAQKVRTLVRRDFEKAFEKVDVLLTPTSPTAAFRLGENESDPMKMYLADVCTVSNNLAGIPGLGVPCGFTASGLPVGMQLHGPAWSEALLLRVARAYEREHVWHTRRAM